MVLLNLSEMASKALGQLSSCSEEAVIHVVHGTDARFYHYLCDGQDDRGWGCGYRTLQSLCSWAAGLTGNLAIGNMVPAMSSHSSSSTASSSTTNTTTCPSAPSLRRIQEVLVEVGDKSPSFTGSCQWIGCCEASTVLDHQYGVSCRLLHIRSGVEVGEVCDQLEKHFKTIGAPVMIGGDVDAASKTLIGVAFTGQGRQRLSNCLIADPHYCGHDDIDAVFAKGAVKWYKIEELFFENSFYNFCLPISKF